VCVIAYVARCGFAHWWVAYRQDIEGRGRWANCSFLSQQSDPLYKPHFGSIFVCDRSIISNLHSIVFLVSYVLFRCLEIDLLLFDDVSSLH
jgi:hypothetical protein